MGRPIKKLFIGNRNSTGIGGEGVGSTTITGAGTGYTTGDAVTFSAPQLPGGTTATGTVVATAGAVDSITITNAGSGYTSAPTVDLTAEGNGDATATAALTTSTQNAIAISAYVVGGSSAVVGDINSQKGSKTYNVTTAQGTSECKLVTSAPAEGEMRITATDSAGGTYYVKKLTNRTVVVLPGTGTQFAEDDKVQWADSATLNVSVALTN